MPQNPVIVIPGITASTLHDDYPLNTEDVWSMVFNKDYRRISLHPDNFRFEAIEPARIYAGQLFTIYNELIEQLRYELSQSADLPTPVFAFPYDWRQDITKTAVIFKEFIEEVIGRTKLLRHYADYQEEKVDLVGHSMGGLIIVEYLKQFGQDKKIGKIATLGTPFNGSVEAIVKIATGMSLLAGGKPSEREREAARITPAVYQLLPSYEGAVVANDENVNIFDPENWQQSIIESLEEYVRVHSVNDQSPIKRRRERAREILSELLKSSATHRKNVHDLKIEDCGLDQTDWLAIIGLGEKTRIQVSIENIKVAKRRRFVLQNYQFISDWNYDIQKKDSINTGDATVPYKGAEPPFLDTNRLVCICDDDLGFFELGEKLTEGIVGFHGMLPKVNLAHRLIIKHFYNQEALKREYRGDVWGMPAPACFDDWNPPIAPYHKKDNPFGIKKKILRSI